PSHPRHLLLSSRSAPHRDLHSFPTRRSSDLSGSRAPRPRVRNLQVQGPAQPAPSRPRPLSPRRLSKRAPRPPLSRLRRPLSLSRSEEHTSELQSRENLVCRLLLEKKKTHNST